MNLISRKLRSKTGASMLIAILFMMFCLFVGGSVLAAATANGSRVAHMADQQDFLSQRSAGSLIADELNSGLEKTAASQEELQLIVEDMTIQYQPVILGNGGGWEHDGDPTQVRIISFEAPFTAGEPMTVMQRLLYETAVCRYLAEHQIKRADIQPYAAYDPDDTYTGIFVKLEKFYYPEAGQSNATEIVNISDFWYSYAHDAAQIGGSLNISGDFGSEAAYTARFDSGDQENMYDFLITFGEFTQMTITSDAYMSTTQIPRPMEVVKIGATNMELTYDNSKTYITWNWAYIEKGGEGV